VLGKFTGEDESNTVLC